MADLTISSAATLTGAGIASGDLFPLVDVSAAAGSKGSKITRDELRIAMGLTGGGVVATAGFTLTVPATGTAALLGTANAFSVANTNTLAALGTTPTEAQSWINSTAAAAGAQQYSPSTVWRGSGWKTNAIAASQAVAYRAFVQTVQGSSASYGVWTLQQSIDGGAYAGGLEYSVSGLGVPDYGRLTVRATNSVHSYSWNVGGDTSSVEQRFNNTCYSVWNTSSQLIVGPTGAFAFASTAGDSIRSTQDTFIKRKAAAIIQLGEDAAGVTNQMLTAASRITSDGVGANLTIAGGNGRGGAGGSLIFSYYTTAGAATIGTLTEAMRINTLGQIVLTGLPAADPGVAGALYHTAGAVMVSL